MHIEGWGGPRTKLYIAEHTFFLQREIIMFLTDVPDGNKRKNQQKKKIKLSFLSHKYKVASYIIEKAGKHYRVMTQPEQ